MRRFGYRRGARIDVARRRARARAAAPRAGGRARRRRSPSTARAGRRGSRSRAPCGSPARPGNPIAAVPHRGRRASGRVKSWDRTRCRSRAATSRGHRRSATPLARAETATSRRETLERGALERSSERWRVCESAAHRALAQLAQARLHSMLLICVPALRRARARRPAIPSGRSAREVFDARRRRLAAAGGRRSGREPATREELARVHTPRYLDAIAATAGRAAMLDPDTFTRPESHEVALLAAGAADRRRREHALRHRRAGVRAGAAAGPPRRARSRDGLLPLQQHRGRRGRGAARAGVERVAIVDIDVHHGNGTQWIVLRRSRACCYVSSHQFPFYPGHRRRGRDGRGRGPGLHGQHAAARPARPTPTTRPRIERSSCRRSISSRRSCSSSPPASTRTSAIRWPSMRMTTAGYARVIGAASGRGRAARGRPAGARHRRRLPPRGAPRVPGRRDRRARLG